MNDYYNAKKLELTAEHKEATADIVINCLRYTDGDGNSAVTSLGSKHEMGELAVVITILGIAWLSALFMLSGFKGAGSYWYLFKYIPLALLPLMGKTRGVTHIRFNPEAMHLETRSGNTLLSEKKIDWHRLTDIKFVPARPGKPTTDGSVAFMGKSKVLARVKLSKIGNSVQWDSFRTALGRWAQVQTDALDANLFEPTLSVRDPSFTALWLDAMICPPQRQRLEPLQPESLLQAGEYVVDRQIGVGGQGRAYLASGRKQGVVVLKEYILPVYVEPRVRKQALQQFESEAKLLRHISHEQIVKSFDSFFEDHRAYLVMEFVDGPSLKDVVSQSGPLAEQRVIEHASNMCDILRYLHGMAPPLVHQDFTPDNLLVTLDGRLKLIDFTIAQHSEGDANALTGGKVHYMPPEQFRGKSIPASDIYALGCTLHFLLTGEDPEPLSPSFPILVRSDVSKQLNDVVARCTAIEPAERFANVDEVLAALRARPTTVSRLSSF